ncbi:MAG TPA: PaaI family thioesterase [Pyrinomonadaceae bacterium]|jgi:uncharacterized protein (TIGR00369 family)
MKLEPKDSNFAEKVRASFARQPVMAFIGAHLANVAAGEVDIQLPYRKYLTQQNGFLHAGITATIIDSACGYAAFTLMPEGSDVLTAEFKINLLSPALGDYFLATGRILKAGKTLTVARGDVFAVRQDEKKLIATMLATIVSVRQNR